MSDVLASFRGERPQEEKASPELGFGGVSIAGGILQDEHVAELQGLQGIRTATRMRRSDGQVRAVMTAIGLPIRHTKWFLEEPEGAGAAEKEATELLRANLFGGMEHAFDDVLREAVLGIYYGWRVPEIVWREDAGAIGIRKVAGRNPELVERWLYDPDGNVAGYLYAGNRPVGTGVEDSAPTMQAVRVPIPLEKTVHFVYDGENDNPQGFGLWRSMFPHWYVKQALYKILAVGIERNLLDVPIGKMGSGAQKDDRAKFLRTLMRWRAAEDAAVVLPDGWELEFKGSQRGLMDGMPFLHHHNTMIAQAGLAQFLNLGQTGEGTQGLASEHVKLFVMAEEANARWIEGTLQQQLIKRWAILNYGPALKPPVLKHAPIRARDITSWTTALNQLVSGGLVHPTIDDEERLRDEFDLPEIPKEQLQKLEAERKQAAQQERERVQMSAMADKTRSADPKADETRKAHEPCGGHAFAETDAQKTRSAAERKFAEQAAEVLNGVQEGYLKALKPLVDQVQQAKPSSRGAPLAQLAEVEIPGAAKYEEFVKGYLRAIFDEGRQALAEETGQDVSKRRVSNGTRTWINVRARVIASDHLAQLKTAVLSRILTGVRAELPTSQIFSDAGAVAVAELSRNAQVEWSSAAAELLDLVASQSAPPSG